MSALPSFHSIENLSPADQALFNQYGRGARVSIPYQIVHHAFEAAAAANPHAIAVRHHDGTTITYQELDRRANVLANELRASWGVKAGDRVVLVYSRCIEMVAFIFAVLKAGAQYVPLDGGIVPEDTLRHVIADSNAAGVLCLPKFQHKVQRSIPVGRESSVKIMQLDEQSTLWQWGNSTNPQVHVEPDNGAYVIYTSGTTGKPKGVDVHHENVTNTLLNEPARLGITVGRNVAQQLNVGFDLCAWEILATMMNGGTLHIRGSGLKEWTECLQRVDTVIGTPSVVLKFMSRRQDFPNIGTIVVGGEPCPLALAETWAPHVKFWNICGPTEITILNTAHLHKPDTVLSIGKPNPNTNVYVLDDNETPVKIGEPGTMWVGGMGVSGGYLNLPELTATRYKPDKFTQDGRMMFNTGDLTRWLDDGSLMPLGRKDDQVKIQGFRVELDGVSRAIEKVPGVVKACALKIEDKLWGFYSAPSPINEAELKSLVGITQPFYAVPSIWHYLPVIALTANGKIDKKVLYNMATEGISEKQQMLIMSSSTSTLQQSSSSSTSTRSGSRDTNLDLEKTPVEDLTEDVEEEEELPAKNGFHGLRWLRYTALSAYRKLFTIILTANLAALIVLLWQTRNDDFQLPLNHLATAVASNLLAAVLLRQDYVVNFIFRVCSSLSTSVPLSVRRHFARVYHNGGVHSGSAFSATVWWLVFTVAASRDYVGNGPSSMKLVVLVLTYVILALLLAILVMAYPAIRAKMHDQFEWVHRFGGWTALALVWSHIIASAAATSPGPLGPALAKTPAIYLVALTTLSVALPWMRLRKVKVVPEPLSRHAIRLHFDFLTPKPCTSLGVRITDRPMVEWHAFAAIPEPEGSGFSIIVSKAGDWTKRIIENPPNVIWTRGTPASGVLAIAPLFKKIVLVATGSGIGPCLPVIMERRVPCRIVWSTKNPLATYGQKILDTVLACDPDALIWDTDERGRPDLTKLAYQVYKESDAECVCVISNRRTIAKVTYQLESRGIAAFGPILDS